MGVHMFDLSETFDRRQVERSDCFLLRSPFDNANVLLPPTQASRCRGQRPPRSLLCL
jgi:hypothetical protein